MRLARVLVVDNDRLVARALARLRRHHLACTVEVATCDEAGALDVQLYDAVLRDIDLAAHGTCDQLIAYCRAHHTELVDALKENP